MKRTTNKSPKAPAVRLCCTDCLPRLAETELDCATVICAGRAPALMSSTNCVALLKVKFPVISVWLLLGLATAGAVSTWLSRKIANCAVGGAEVVVPPLALQPGFLVHAALVNFDQTAAPWPLKVMSTA